MPLEFAARREPSGRETAVCDLERHPGWCVGDRDSAAVAEGAVEHPGDDLPPLRYARRCGLTCAPEGALELASTYPGLTRDFSERSGILETWRQESNLRPPVQSRVLATELLQDGNARTS